MAVKRLRSIESWKDLRNKVGTQLIDTSWWLLPDSQLTDEQVAIGTQWRFDMMSVMNNEDFEAAKVTYMELLSLRPKWDL